MSTSDAVDIQTVLALEERLDQAMRTADVDALDQLLADDLIFTGNHGRLITKGQDLALHRSGELALEQVRSSERAVRLLGGTAVVALRLQLTGRQGGRRFEAAFRFTRIWTLRGDRWQLVAAHASGIAA